MKKLLLFACLLPVGFRGMAQTYVPVPLSGFTADVIADGSGAVSAVTTNDVDGASFAFVSQNYVNPSNASPTTALPTNGTINSAATPGVTFQLAPYTANNSLRISGVGSGTLTFTTPRAADQLYLLATSGSGISTATVTVTFTDATTQVFASQTISDWYNGAGYAIRGISRVSRATNAIENFTDNPRLYQFLLTISPANTVKTIQSISINKTSTTGVLNVMGATIHTVPSTLALDAAVTAIVTPLSGCPLTNQETITVTVTNYGTVTQNNIPVSYKINNGAVVNEILAGPLNGNSSVDYSFATKANLSAVGTYTLEARTNLTGDQLATNDISTRTVTLTAAPATPTISASGPTSICSGSSVMLTAATPGTGVTYQWFYNGVPITGSIAATYPVSNAGNYTVVANAGGCSSPVSAATTIIVNYNPPTPALTASGPTAFCTGGSVVLNAATPVSGANYVWFKNNAVITGATGNTYTATTSGNYAVSVNTNGCDSPTSTAMTVAASASPLTPTITQAGPLLTSSSAAGNQWYKNNVLISGAVGRTYNTTSNGSYTVMVTTNGCTSAVSNTVTITNTGLAENLAGLQMNVYPNPSTGLFNLTLPQGQTCQIMVSDLTGKVLKQQTVKTKEIQLDLSKAAKGIYFLKVVSEGKTVVRKLVIE